MFSEKAGTTKVIVASRYKESPVYLIEKSPTSDVKNDHRFPVMFTTFPFLTGFDSLLMEGRGRWPTENHDPCI
jgi:hypothetical protein